MKKLSEIMVLVILLTGIMWGGDNISVSAAVNYFGHADTNYADVYGSGAVMPELQVHFSIGEKFFAGAAAGFFSQSGETPVLQAEATSNQTILFLGGGYRTMISDNMGFLIKLGLVDVIYKEEALGLEATGSAIGAGIGTALLISLSEKIFGQVQLGFITASKDIDGETAKFGGFKAGIGAGIYL